MRRSRIGFVVASLATVIGGAGIASATIPDSQGKITACYVKGLGVLRVVDTEAGSGCSSREQALVWNQEGRRGERGASGTSEGVSRFTANVSALTAEGNAVSHLALPAGSYIINGFASVENTGGSARSQVVCHILSENRDTAHGSATLEPGGASTITLSGSGVLTHPGTVELFCQPGTEATGQTNALQYGMNAIRVDVLDNQNLDP